MILRIAGAACGLLAVAPAPAGDVFLLADRDGYGITRAVGDACFAIAPSAVASEGASLYATLPGVFRLPAKVVHTFDANVAVVLIGEDGTACQNRYWSEGNDLETALGRTGIGSLELRLGDGTVGRMHVHVDEIEPGGFFTISPVVDPDRLMESMSGSRILLEDKAAGMLLSVDEEGNRGRVIRQDVLSSLIAPFFESLMDSELTDSGAAGGEMADSAVTDTVAVDSIVANGVEAGSVEAGSVAADSVAADSAAADSVEADSVEADSARVNSDAVDSVAADPAGIDGVAITGVAVTGVAADSIDAGNDVTHTEPTGTAQAKPRPEIVHRFFIGKQTWRNNPTIVGNRLFVGSSGREWNKPDVLDGVYSFNLDTGEKIWFVHTDNDANDLTYINGLIAVGTDSGEVLGIGARSGKTYWTRKFDGKVYARPVQLPTGVAIATSVGGLYVLNLKDGVTRASSRLNAGVRAGLVAAQNDLWVATESGTLYRYVGFGDVQIRRRSRIFYPDEFGKKLSGVAIEWYERLGQGRGRRAKFYGAPLVLGDRVILSVVRQAEHEYPPVMAFAKDGGLDWIGTDPDGIVNNAYGDSRITPASWFDELILADPYSNAIYSMSSNSGEVLWAVDLGHPTFQQWASPVIENDYVYVARHDGFLHKLQANDGKRIWSMYFGQYAHAGKTFLENEPLPKMESGPIWSTQLASPIFSTPAVSDNTIVVGTDEGYLYIIKDTE